MNTPNVITALAAITAELPAISKTDKAPQGYAYRGIEAITAHLQPLLAKHGVVIVPSSRIVTITPAAGMKEGWHDVQLEVTWAIYGPAGASDVIYAATCGIGRDNSDKGANKAATQAFKYLLLQLFSIADKSDDSDATSYDHGRAPERQPDPRQQAAAELFEACKLVDDTTKNELRLLATDAGRKISQAAFLADQQWFERVATYIGWKVSQ